MVGYYSRCSSNILEVPNINISSLVTIIISEDVILPKNNIAILTE
jgi:hypothetical protein